MRHFDRRLALATVAILCLQSGAGLTAEHQAIRQENPTRGRLLAENPPKAFDFKDFDFWANQCRSFSSEKLYPEALEACEKAIPLNPEKDKKKQQQQTLDLWKLRSHALFHLGRYQEAIGSYDYVLGIQPAYSLGLTNRCDALAHLGRYDAAIASCDQALRLDGDWGESSPAAAAYLRGTTLRKAGKLEAAIASYDQALVANPEDVAIVAERCDTVLALKRAQTDALVQSQSDAKEGALPGNAATANAIDRQGQRAELESALKNTEAAGNTCTKTLETIDKPAADAPKPPAQAFYKRGLVFKRQQRFAEAQASFKAAASAYEQDLAANPNDPVVWTNQGMALEQLYQDARALTAYEKAVQLRPTTSLALMQQCGVLNRLRRFQSALAACDAALKGDGLWGDSSSAYAWSQRSSALLGMKQYEDAVASAERAIALNPDDAEAYNYKAVGLWYLKDYAEAEKAAQTATVLDSHYPQAFATLGKILSSQKQYQAAYDRYENARQVYIAAIAQEFKPENPLLKADILINLASMLWQLEKSGQALDFAKQASDANPQSFEIQLNYGIIALQAKAYSDALDAFQQANQLSPNNLYVLTGQGRALQGQADMMVGNATMQTEKYKQSIATLRVALSLNPNYEPARKSYREVNESMKKLQLRSIRKVTLPQPR